VRFLPCAAVCLLGCNNTTLHTDLPAESGCSDEEESRELLPLDEQELGFTADELRQTVSRLALADDGAWGLSTSGPDPATLEMRSMSLTADELDPPQLVMRPEGVGHLRYGPDGRCPAGKLMRLTAIVEIDYEFDGQPISLNWRTPVEANGLSPDQIWFWRRGSMVPQEQKSDGLDDSFSAVWSSWSRLQRRGNSRTPIAAYPKLEGSGSSGEYTLSADWGIAYTVVHRFEYEE